MQIMGSENMHWEFDPRFSMHHWSSHPFKEFQIICAELKDLNGARFCITSNRKVELLGGMDTLRICGYVDSRHGWGYPHTCNMWGCWGMFSKAVFYIGSINLACFNCWEWMKWYMISFSFCGFPRLTSSNADDEVSTLGFRGMPS